jgi:hypothetical protein
MAETARRHRPIGVTILAILAAFAGFLAAIHCLQALGIFPYIVGDYVFRNFNLWAALMWGLLAYIYFWLVQMLWRVNPSAWLFFVIITIFNLVVGGMSLLFTDTQWGMISGSMILNALILIYMWLPWVRRSFAVAE